MARRTITTIRYDGPFFRKDPARTFRQNIRTMLDATAQEGATDVRAQLAAGNASRAPIRYIGDHVSAHVVGRVHSLSGKPWAVTAVVSVNNSGYSKRAGIALMAAASEVEGRTGAFRRTQTRVRRAKAVNAAELLKGIE